MYRNVHIKGVGTHHPKRKVSNEYYIEHFKKYNKERHASILFRKFGRKVRTLAEENETSLTMSLEAAKKALKNANLKSEDIDIIISASDTPEYLSPSCALIMKKELNATNVTTVFDMNSDCIGALEAIDVASRYLKTDKKYKRALIVSSFLVSRLCREDDIVTYGIMSDGGAAVVLEVKEEDEERGFLGSRMYTDATNNEKVRFPACGLSKIVDENTKNIDRRSIWKHTDFSFLPKLWTENITKLLEEYEYTPEDVQYYFMSQFSKSYIKSTFRKLGTTMDKTTFVAEKYGYTGCTSPIMALDDKLKEYKFDKNDVVVFCSVAAGYSIASLLYKW